MSLAISITDVSMTEAISMSLDRRFRYKNATKGGSWSDNDTGVKLTESSIWMALWMTSRYWKSTMQPVTETYV